MRTQFELGALITIVCGLLIGYELVVPCRTVSAKGKPNLVIIHTDEHNFRTLGCYRELLPEKEALMWGNAVVQTPQIDWIAHHGAICTSFYATTPVCSPSRSAFVSGCYPQTTRVVTNDIPMKDQLVTFAEVLRRQGYATGYAGKWHLDGTGKPQWAPRRKFGFEDNRYMFNRGHWKQLEDTADGPAVAARGKGGRPSYSVQGATEESFTTDFLANKTIAFIDAHQDQPFCFMVSIPDPHGPDSVRPPYDTMFADQSYRKPRSYDVAAEGLPSWAAKTKCGFGQAKYYGMIKCIDDNVGKILSCLRQKGLLEKTIVVFTSDHGDLRGEHARQNKGVPFEGSARIPFVIYDPGVIRPRTIVHQAIACVDFKSTILSLMRVELVGPNEGRDCAKLFIDGQTPPGWHDVVFVRGTGGGATGQWVAAMTDRYKLVCGPADHPWLYDLKKDPDELVNCFLDPEYRDTVESLCGALAHYGQKYHDPRVADPGIQYDLAWGAKQGENPYRFDARPVFKPKVKASKRRRAGRGRKKPSSKGRTVR